MLKKHFINGKIGLILAGLLLLVWGATSAFSDFERIKADQPSPIDNPDSAGAQITIPAQSLIYPTPTAQAGATGGGEGDAFTIPLNGTPTPAQKSENAVGAIPERIVIPKIGLDAPILPVPYRLVKEGNNVFQQWTVPDQFAAGWQTDSAPIGVPGNTVLNGHHNVWGEVFGKLVDLNPGDFIEVTAGDIQIRYVITNKMILPERGQPLSVRFENARWLLPTNDERLTLVTCWPHWSNTHRLIIVAVPVERFDKAGRIIQK